jgi:hypothetical protein
MMFRKAAVCTAGLAMTAGLGLAGVGTASAAAPALHIKTDSIWTFKEDIGPCERDVFEPNGTWASSRPVGDVGTWSGGGPTIKVKWTAGPGQGFRFHGTSYVAASKEYLGYIGTKASHSGAKLIEGLVSGC